MDSANLRHTFAARIKELRNERELNQGEFADFVGVSRGAMSYYEQEARTPDIGVLRMICEKCGVSADYMTGLIPDRDREVSDVCQLTGLDPKAARRLRILQKLKSIRLESALTAVEAFDADAQEALKLTAHTAATPMINVLLSNDSGLEMLTLLSGIIFGAELYTGSDNPPRFIFKTNHRDIEVAMPVSDLTSALWVDVQVLANNLKSRFADADKSAERPQS
jgi:transcriptional regulator with XRE-family HTH domain